MLGGVLKECNVHDLDLILYLFNMKKYPKINYFYQGKDYFHSKMKYKDLEITFTTFWHKILGRNTKRRFEIFFQKAAIFAEDFFIYGNITVHPLKEKKIIFNRDWIFDNYIEKKGLPEVLKAKKHLYSFIPILNFLDCILNNKETSPNFKDCARAEKFCEILVKREGT